jgi:hypothetical protein
MSAKRWGLIALAGVATDRTSPGPPSPGDPLPRGIRTLAVGRSTVTVVAVAVFTRLDWPEAPDSLAYPKGSAV